MGGGSQVHQLPWGLHRRPAGPGGEGARCLEGQRIIIISRLAVIQGKLRRVLLLLRLLLLVLRRLARRRRRRWGSAGPHGWLAVRWRRVGVVNVLQFTHRQGRVGGGQAFRRLADCGRLGHGPVP